MIDTKELREKIIIKGLDVVADTDILEILDRLEAAESEALEEARLNGMGSEREAALLSKLEAAKKERDALRAEVQTWQDQAKAYWSKIERMEQQEPVAWADAFGEPFRKKSEIDGVASPLYALPGAQNVASSGAKWADDEGGKPEFKWPKVVERAHAMLAAAPKPEAKP